MKIAIKTGFEDFVLNLEKVDEQEIWVEITYKDGFDKVFSGYIKEIHSKPMSSDTARGD